MGTIVKDQQRGTWTVRYRTPERKQSMKRGFKTKRDAELWLADNTVKKAEGRFISPSAGKVTVAVAGEQWVQNQTHLKASTFRAMESAWRVHVLPRWGRIQLADIDRTDVQSWLSLMTGQKSATLVIRCHGIMAKILDNAVADKRIDANPARGVNLPRKVKKEHIYLTHAQVWALADEAKYPTLVLVLAYTGLRWGEATGLRVKDINPLRKRLSVVQNAVDVGGKVVVGTPKNHKRRTVPYPAFLSDALEKQVSGKGPDDLVFSAPNGGYLRRTGLSENSNGWFINALRRAGLPKMTIHDLRHTTASLAISAGANVKAIQAMLGHSSAAMTLDTYADLFPDDLDAVASAMNDAAAQTSVLIR